MKKLLIILVVISMFSVGCKAFNESYEHDGEGGTDTLNTVESTSADLEVTVCTAMENVTVDASLKSGFIKETVLSTLEDGVIAEAIAKELEDDIVKITISADGTEKVAIVIKKVADKEFVACSMTYEGKAVASGTITVDSFNRGTKVVNAGTFTLEITEDDDAVKVNKLLMSGRFAKSKVISVEGSYHTEGLQE